MLGDTILEVDRKQISTPKEWNEIISSHQQGTKVHFAYKHRSNVVETTLQIGTNKAIYVAQEENISKKAEAFKAAWLRSSSIN